MLVLVACGERFKNCTPVTFTYDLAAVGKLTARRAFKTAAE